MPKDEADPEDPMALVGIELPVASEAETAEMADCFIEEFARMGWDRARVLHMFRTPFYAAAHRIWRRMGEDFVLRRMEMLAPYFREERRSVGAAPAAREETHAPGA